MSNPRLMRTELLLGSKGISALQNSTVMIIGLGAVGGYALEAIARSGVGTLILVDFDSFDETNVNRQILALTSTIGQKKTSVAASRVKEINPDCKVIIKDMYVEVCDVYERSLEDPIWHYRLSFDRGTCSGWKIRGVS